MYKPQGTLCARVGTMVRQRATPQHVHQPSAETAGTIIMYTVSFARAV